MARITAARQLNRLMIAITIGAAVGLLLDPVPAWVRILPWIIVFSYPLWRMARSQHSAHHE